MRTSLSGGTCARCKSLIKWFGPLCLALAITSGLRAQPAEGIVPKLNSRVPVFVQRARTPSQECLTDVNHHDPCASVRIAKVRFTIAWDAGTKAITYIFTDDVRLIMDSELSVGGLCSLVRQSGERWELAQYLNWVITPAWRDTVERLSGDAYWHAVFRPEAATAEYGAILGFVQSRYLRN